ncbi:oligosaccharide flippase family protein [Candidatus Peregrinibacteria bacterium]|nr:oligosaccharide flippase family protein [Candidatus Peregrinibacteria bacterium]
MFAKLKKDQFLKNNIIFFAGSMLTAFFSYLFYPVLARLMTLPDFGETQALISLSAQFGVFFGGLSLISITILANVEDLRRRSMLIGIIQKLTLMCSFALFLFIVIFSERIESFFQFSSYLPFIVMAFLLPCGVILTIRSAILQAKNDFKSTTFVGLIGVISRILFAAFFVYMGWRSFGAVVGLAIAQLLSLAYVFYKTHRDIDASPTWLEILSTHWPSIKSGLKYVFFVFAGLGLMTFFYAGDILVIKHFFSPVEAGLYSGISTVAKIIYFATGSVSAVLLPNVKLGNPVEANRRYLLKSILIVCLIGGTGMVFFSIFPEFVIKILMGGRYLVKVGLLVKLSMAMFLISLINVFLYYFLALRRYFFIIALALGVAVELTLSYFYHSDPDAIVNGFLGGAVSIFLIIGIGYIVRFLHIKTLGP